MVASPCLIEQPKTEARAKRFELGAPGSAASPLPAELAPSRVMMPEPSSTSAAWTQQQCETWDILVAAMWRGLL
jgi:hypothetical protein